MPKRLNQTTHKNIIGKQIILLRKEHNISQRDLEYRLQLAGYDMDKNVITRIETNKRFVSDIELKAFCEVFNVSYKFLLDGSDT